MGVLVRGVGDGGSGREWKAGGALNVYMEDGKWGQGGGWGGRGGCRWWWLLA